MPTACGSFSTCELSGLRDPEELPGAVRAAELLHAAIRDGRRITVYGDYDADGMTATAILLLCLQLLGAKADYYIPNRIDEGYGLNHDALRTIAAAGRRRRRHGRLRHHQRGGSGNGPRAGADADHHRSSPTARRRVASETRPLRASLRDSQD